MPDNALTVAYLVAAILFIRSLGGLSTQQSARRGNLYGIVGMAIAVVATALQSQIVEYRWMAVALLLGGAIGVTLALRVVMTAMPELVALLHSFVGLAAVIVGMANYLGENGADAGIVTRIETWADVAVGAITFTGSVIAWGKFKGTITGRPVILPGRNFINLALVIGVVALAWPMAMTSGTGGLWALLTVAVVAGILGVHIIMAIGGADMPVVVSLLNSASGWAAALAGFMLGNDLLIVTGALVGSSGAILSIIMCRGMNRSILNVIAGGFGGEGGAPEAAAGVEGEVTTADLDEVRRLLLESRKVVIVPGYGMAVAHAQHPVKELTDLLRKHGISVRFAIHPVAGRLPGHMNVLLAEAGVPYDIVEEMDEINPDLDSVDTVLVVGANDIVNPGAQEDETSPIYGMPVIEVWKATTVVVLKRSMGTGYAGVQNPLFFKKNTRMLFGDARDSISKLVAAVRLAA